MKKIRWGVLSTAQIGTEKVIPAMQLGKYCKITAIASRKLKKAQAAAKRLGIEKAYGSYEKLLIDPDIDAVYIPLPNHLHVPWAIKVLNAGKHVLCEKPIALSTAEAQTLLDAAKNFPQLKIMEAFMYRTHPQWQRVKHWISEGRIGKMRMVQTFFTYHNTNPHNIRNNSEVGGGGLMDIGCYCISLARFIFEIEPCRVCGTMEVDPKFKIDRLTSGILDFGNGTSSFTCATQLLHYQRASILGTKGRIEIEMPFTPSPDKSCKIWLEDDAGIEEVTMDICNQHTIQGDLFSQAVLEDKEVPEPLEDAVANMQVIEAITQSAMSKNWIQVKTCNSD